MLKDFKNKNNENLLSLIKKFKFSQKEIGIFEFFVEKTHEFLDRLFKVIEKKMLNYSQLSLNKKEI